VNLQDIQAALREQRFDAWLFYDYHHRDPVGNMRISDTQLERYATAVMRFWHLAGASPV
jgi:hypothetical protein